MTDWHALIGQQVTVRNDRGAQYRGTVKAVTGMGDILLNVTAIALVSNSSPTFDWQRYKKPEVTRITEPELVKGENEC